MPRLQLQLERSAYAPGETVRGWVRALEGGKSRGGIVALRYVERTEDYTELPWDDQKPLWEGELADSASFSFELQVPPHATPGHTSENGSLSWEVFVRSDEFGRDTTVAEKFELIAPPGGYPESPFLPPPHAGNEWAGRIALGGTAFGAGIGYLAAKLPGAIAGGAVVGAGSILEWRRRAKHFEVEPPPPVRRGERVRIAARPTETALRGLSPQCEAELRCVERYDYRSYTSRSSSRETKENTLHSERTPLGAQPWAEIRVPPEMPFSYEGTCLSYEWKAIVREHRENALDRVAERSVVVLP